MEGAGVEGCGEHAPPGRDAGRSRLLERKQGSEVEQAQSSPPSDHSLPLSLIHFPDSTSVPLRFKDAHGEGVEVRS